MFIGGGTSFDRTFITFFWGDHGGLNKNVEVYENPGRFMGQQPCNQTVSLELIKKALNSAAAFETSLTWSAAEQRPNWLVCQGGAMDRMLGEFFDQHRLGNENMHFWPLKPNIKLFPLGKSELFETLGSVTNHLHDQLGAGFLQSQVSSWVILWLYIIYICII